MDDSELLITPDSAGDTSREDVPDQTIPPAVAETSVEGVPMPDNATAPADFAKAGDEGPAPQNAGEEVWEGQTGSRPAPAQEPAPTEPKAPPQGPAAMVCPRCGNLIPSGNFCPVCALSLRGYPPATPVMPVRPAPPRPAPVYCPPPQYDAARSNPAQMPSAAYYGGAQVTPPHVAANPPPPPAGGYSPYEGATAGAPISGGVPSPYAPAAYHNGQPPYGSAPRYGERPPRRQGAPARWFEVVGIIFGAFVTIMLILITGLLIYIASILPESYASQSNYGYPPVPGGNSEDYSGGGFPLPENILPQYFIGDTVTQNSITYEFEYSFTDEEEGTPVVILGVTFKNNSSKSCTLTRDLFRLEDVEGNPCTFYVPNDKSAKNTLDRTVLMPGETASKLLIYATTPGEYDYLPLYVLNNAGNELFYVYVSLYDEN